MSLYSKGENMEKLKLFHTLVSGSISYPSIVKEINEFVAANPKFEFFAVEQVGSVFILHYRTESPT